jgi:hypothetical protein
MSKKYDSVVPTHKPAKPVSESAEDAYQRFTNLNTYAAPKYLDQSKKTQKQLLNEQLELRQIGIAK